MKDTKLKRLHPNMEQFIYENQYSIDRFHELADKALAISNDVISEVRVKEPNLPDRLIKHGLQNYLDERSISLMTNPSVGNFFYLRKYREICGHSNYDTKLNIFGFLKIGDRSVQELEEDVFNLYVHDEKHDTTYLDLGRAINVGINLEPLRQMLDDEGLNVQTCLVVDVDATLLRAMSSTNYLNNVEEVEENIVRTIVNKIIILHLSKFNYNCVVDNIITCSPYPMSDLRTIAKILFAYKIFYNAVNDIDDIDINKSVENIMELIDLAERTQNSNQAIPTVFNTIHNKIVCGKMDVVRFIDRKIEQFMDFYRTAMNYYSFRDINGRRMHGSTLGRINGADSRSKLSIKVEQVATESFLSNAGIKPGFRERKRASLTIIGAESADSEMYEYFKKNNRATILSKLEYKERITYIKYENDLMKFKSEAIGCRTEFTKGCVLKRGDTIGKLIQTELSQHHSDEFVNLMCMLDSERVSVQSDLASRDLYRERTTMLNGMISTKNEWNY